MESLLSFTSEYPITLIAISVTTCYVTYYVIQVVKRPLLICRDGEWREFLQENLSILQESYWPTPWCIDGRLQSVIGGMIRWGLPDIQYEREVLNLKDGGILSLDWVNRPQREDQPVLIILPGLSGTSQGGYIKGIINTLSHMDVCCVVINYRGMADTELKTTRTFCKANCSDFEEVLEHIRSLYPKVPFVATGISLGGIWVTNYLATRGEKAAQFLVAALVFSVPWNLSIATQSLETPGWNLLLNYALTRSLCRIYEKHRPYMDGHHPWSSEQVMKSKTIRQFDNWFTALNFGFRGVDEYYQAASLHDKLHEIKVPLLCLTAADDFFQPLEGVPMAGAIKSSHVALVVTSRGGHMGFMEGLIPIKTYYSDRLLGQFFKGIFSDLNKIRNVKKEGDEYAKNNTKYVDIK